MIDKKLVISKLEDLCREVSRVEFSHDYKPFTVECAVKSRMQIEELINQLRYEPEQD